MSADNKYQGLNQSNCDVVVENNSDMTTLAFTIRKMNSWGLSDGSLSDFNWISEDPEYTLTQQIEGSNIYIKK